MTLYAPNVPMTVPAFNAIPQISKFQDNKFLNLLPKMPNSVKIYFTPSQFNSSNDFKMVGVKIISQSNRNPFVQNGTKYSVTPSTKANGIGGDKLVMGTVRGNIFYTEYNPAGYIEIPTVFFISNLKDLSTSTTAISSSTTSQVTVSDASNISVGDFVYIGTSTEQTQQKLIVGKSGNTLTFYPTGALISGSNTLKYSTINSDTLNIGGVNEVYKTQIKLFNYTQTEIVNSDPYFYEGSTDPNISEWSSVILMKPLIFKGMDTTVGLVGLTQRDGLSLSTLNTPSAEFNTFQISNTESFGYAKENISEVKFYLYDSSFVLYDESTSITIPDGSIPSISWTNEKSMYSGTIYYLMCYIKTENEYETYLTYKVTPSYSRLPLGVSLQAISDDTEGRVLFKIDGRQIIFEANNKLSVGNNNPFDIDQSLRFSNIAESDIGFINSDNKISQVVNGTEYYENALKIGPAVFIKPEKMLNMETSSGNWSVFAIIGGLENSLDNRNFNLETKDLTLTNLNNSYIFKVPTDNSHSYFVVPVCFEENGNVYNEFHFIKYIETSTLQGQDQYLNINNYSREKVPSSVEYIITDCIAYMNNEDFTISGYDLISNSSNNTAFSSPEDTSNKYLIHFGETDLKQFIYVEHLNPGTGITKTINR